MVSHSMDDLAAMCDRVVVLKEGEIVRQGTPAHVFMHAAKLNEIGLGLPARSAWPTRSSMRARR